MAVGKPNALSNQPLPTKHISEGAPHFGSESRQDFRLYATARPKLLTSFATALDEFRYESPLVMLCFTGTRNSLANVASTRLPFSFFRLRLCRIHRRCE